MTTAVEYRCPNCGHHLFDTHAKTLDQAPTPTPPPAQAPPPQAPANGDTGRDGAICPECGGSKKPGFDLCIDCNRQAYDDCPNGCGRRKKKQFPVCYECSQAGKNAPAATDNRAGDFLNPHEEEEDPPF